MNITKFIKAVLTTLLAMPVMAASLVAEPVQDYSEYVENEEEKTKQTDQYDGYDQNPFFSKGPRAKLKPVHNVEVVDDDQHGPTMPVNVRAQRYPANE